MVTLTISLTGTCVRGKTAQETIVRIPQIPPGSQRILRRLEERCATVHLSIVSLQTSLSLTVCASACLINLDLIAHCGHAMVRAPIGRAGDAQEQVTVY
ncbi:hypothetical protein RRG08_033200 [Elysia crispata]|uniref:Uncharacterized protein n=1 Tax=Elysia crispata TaxID=231223 RepID=A0AAE1BBN8_9GAST|nr:hypothetical protein RRG08_033200 [Elysia crispata]